MTFIFFWAEAYLVGGNLGLYSGSSALLSPTSPSASSSVPSMSQDSHMSGRHVEDRDRASPVATAAGSSQCRDSTSSNNSTNIGGSSNSTATGSSKRLDRQSRESLDGKSSSSSTQSRTHSHTFRHDGHCHQEKGGWSHRERENSIGSHRRGSHVSPDSVSRRNSLEIKRESTDSERALKEVSKRGHTPPREAKIKDEKSDTDTNRLDDNNKKQVENPCYKESPQRGKPIIKDRHKNTNGPEKVNNVDTSGKTGSRQISSLSVDANDSDNVKTERISPVASSSVNKAEIKDCASEKGKVNVETSGQTKENIETNENSKDILTNNIEGDDKKENAQVDKDFTFVEKDRRKSTDSSSVRSEPIDIRPQRDVKESASPEKMGSEVSFTGSTGSSAAPDGRGCPTGQKDSSGVKQEKSPSGSAGSSGGPAKVLTSTSGGVVYAMYPAAGG